MQHSTTPEILTLDEVKNHFDHWRLTRTKQGKIPQSLWSEVKTLIGRYPISKIAQALHVSAYQISASLDNKTEFTFVKAVSTAQESEPVPRVETSSSIDKEATCSFEIHRPNGSLIKISDFPVVSLANIITQFVE